MKINLATQMKSLMLFMLMAFGSITQVNADSINLSNMQSWKVYDNTPAGATVTSVTDEVKGTVAELSGSGQDNGYVIGGWENSKNAWNTPSKSIKWSMKYSEPYTIFVRVMTKNGGRYVMYTNTSRDYAIEGVFVHIGLGVETIDGTWKNIQRNLEEDLQRFEPNNHITAVNGFNVRGSGHFSEVVLAESEKPKDGHNVSLHLESSEHIVKTLTAGETLTISGKSFTENMGKAGQLDPTTPAIRINGQEGANQTVIIEDCLFKDLRFALHIDRVDNVIIRRTNLVNVGNGIKVTRSKNGTIHHIYVDRFGMYRSGNADGVTAATEYNGGFNNAINFSGDEAPWKMEFEHLDIHHIVIDNSKDTRSVSTQENTLKEDYISLYGLYMKEGERAKIHDIYMYGADTDGFTGGGVLGDHSKGVDAYNITIFNVSGYPIGGWDFEDFTFKNVIAYYTQEHGVAMWSVVGDPLKSDGYVQAGARMTKPKSEYKLNNIYWENCRLKVTSGPMGSPVNMNINYNGYKDIVEDPSNKIIFGKGNTFKAGGEYGVSDNLHLEPTKDEVLDILQGKDRRGMFENLCSSSEWLQNR